MIAYLLAFLYDYLFKTVFIAMASIPELKSVKSGQ